MILLIRLQSITVLRGLLYFYMCFLRIRKLQRIQIKSLAEHVADIHEIFYLS